MKKLVLRGAGEILIKVGDPSIFSSFIIKMEYVVDMQGFKKPGNDFVLKKLAILPLNSDIESQVYLFKAPFPWRKLTEKYKRENLWLELCFHGLDWHSGEFEYTEVGNILRENLEDATRIYVIGELKQKWLERFGFKVLGMNDLNYPPFDHPKQVTIYTHHDGAYKATCALHNVKLMKKFYFNMEWEDVSSDEEI